MSVARWNLKEAGCGEHTNPWANLWSDEQFKVEQDGDILVTGLRTLTEIEADDVKRSFVESKEIQAKIQSLELMYNGMNKIDTFIEADSSVGFIDENACSAIGLGLSMDKKGQIGLGIGTSNEKLPEEITKDKTTAAIDLKVLKNEIKTSKLDVPTLITIPKPDTIETDDFQLYHMNAGEAEEVDFVYEDGFVTFAANEFSTFVFAEDAEPENEENSVGSGSSGSSRGDNTPAYAHMDRYVKTSTTDLQVGGAWITDENGWWYKNPDGTYPSDCWMRSVQNGVDTWYRFNENGYMVSGWYQDKDGKWYFLHDKADGNQGYMYTGWKEINGKWYYFHETADGPKGSLLVNGETPDGYRTDSDGAWIK